MNVLSKTRILSVALLLLASACSDSSADPKGKSQDKETSTRSSVITQLHRTIAIPAYEEVGNSTKALRKEIETMCSTDVSQGIEEAQAAWKEAARAWGATRSLWFGATQETTAMSSVDFPADPSKLAELLESDAALTEVSLAGLGADQRGLSAIEFFLFSDVPPDARHCEYLVAASKVTEQGANDLLRAWESYPLSDVDMYVDDLVSAMTRTVLDISTKKLGAASGAVGGLIDPKVVDLGRAQYLLKVMDSQIDGLLKVLGSDGTGISNLIEQQSPGLVQRLREEISALQDQINAIPTSLAEVTDNQFVIDAYEKSLPPLRTLQTEVVSVLGVTLTLTDADGDS